MTDESLIQEKSETVLPVVRQLPRLVTNPQPRKRMDNLVQAKNPIPKGLSLLWNTSRTSIVEGSCLIHLIIFRMYQTFRLLFAYKIFIVFKNIFSDAVPLTRLNHIAVLPTPITRFNSHRRSRPRHDNTNDIGEKFSTPLLNSPLLSVPDITNGKMVYFDVL